MEEVVTRSRIGAPSGELNVLHSRNRKYRKAKARWRLNTNRHIVDPATRRELFTCRLPAYVLWWLEKQTLSCGVIVEQALLSKYRIDCDEIVGVPPERERFLSPENWCDSEVLDEIVRECNASGERI